METSHPYALPSPEKHPHPPAAFCTDVRAAGERKQAGMLRLLRLEAGRYPWAEQGVALAGQALAAIPARPRWDHAILFSGHRIDDPFRDTPRFPAASEHAARVAIERSLRLLVTAGQTTVGIAGGASGGDLLFHEVCAQLGVASLLRLTLPEKAYVELSVSPAGGNWQQRFAALTARLGQDQVETLGQSRQLPAWLLPNDSQPPYNIWQRTNLWLLEECLALAPRRSVLALWDGKAGDGPGGTEHLLRSAEAAGITQIEVIATGDL